MPVQQYKIIAFDVGYKLAVFSCIPLFIYFILSAYITVLTYRHCYPKADFAQHLQ